VESDSDEIEDFTSDEEVITIPPKTTPSRNREVITIDSEPEIIVLDDEDSESETKPGYHLKTAWTNSIP
jgi:hypothetical protein